MYLKQEPKLRVGRKHKYTVWGKEVIELEERDRQVFWVCFGFFFKLLSIASFKG